MKIFAWILVNIFNEADSSIVVIHSPFGYLKFLFVQQ